MIEIYLLEQLAAFAKYGTLTRAAEELHISQPALTRSMKKLESNLGIVLFERDKKKLRLNETGRLAASLAALQVEENKAMVSRLISFDRSLHSIRIGSCAPMPISELMPILQDHFGDMMISSELVYGDMLFSGLKNGIYQLAVFEYPPQDEEIYCQRFMQEHLYISVPASHRLAQRKKAYFEDLNGERFLLFQHIGFWKTICQEHMKNTNFLIQSDRDAFYELVENTNYPSFCSDAVLRAENPPDNRVYIPLDEEQASCTYYVACRSQDKQKYSSFFSAVRGAALR